MTPDDTQPTLTQRLEAFAVDYGLMLAGWVAHGPDDLVPFERSQMAVLMTAAVSAHAKSQPDYDPKLDITKVVELGAHTYIEATKANVLRAFEALEHGAPLQPINPEEVSPELREPPLEYVEDDLGPLDPPPLLEDEPEPELEPEGAAGEVASGAAG